MEILNKFQSWLQDKFKNKKNVILLLLAIILVGTFLRTYQHKNWLYFDDDQANDATIVDNFIHGRIKLPELGPNMGNTQFCLGPMFYYFQIASAEFFGDYPDKLAYPDLFFSILTIPLLFYFLKKYFSANLSLTLTGLYTISYFAIKFSRFAWNTNSMPFFILLFLLAMLEFLKNREKTSWWWALALGLATGVGVQLHAMLLVIFPIMGILVIIFTAKAGWQIWPKWLAVILIALSLNGGLIKHEIDFNFQNTYYFLLNATDRSGSGAGKFMNTVALDAVCHAQANTYILAALGNKDNCNFLDTKLRRKTGAHYLAALDKPGYLGLIIFSLAFSLIGYFLLIKRLLNEKDREKKCFLGIIVLYLFLFFLIMFPSISEAPLRYFLPMFFVPYIFLGFIIEELAKKISGKYLFLTVAIITIAIAMSNVTYLFSLTNELKNKSRSGSSDVILDEIEPMRDYIISRSAPRRSAYLFGGSQYLFRFYQPIWYLARLDGFTIEKMVNQVEGTGQSKIGFYIYQSYPGKHLTKINGMQILDYKNFGPMAVYEVIKVK